MPAPVLRMLKFSRTACHKYNVELSSVVEFRIHSQKLVFYASCDRTSPWKAMLLSALSDKSLIDYRLTRRCKAPVRLEVIGDYSAGTLSTFVAGIIAQGGTVVSDGWSGYARLKDVEHDPKVIGETPAHGLISNERPPVGAGAICSRSWLADAERDHRE
jgi:hypothetical protein